MKCLTCCAVLCSTLCVGAGVDCLDGLEIEIPDCRATLDAVVAAVDVGCDAEACPLTRSFWTSPVEVAAGVLGLVLEAEAETAEDDLAKPRAPRIP